MGKMQVDLERATAENTTLHEKADAWEKEVKASRALVAELEVSLHDCQEKCGHLGDRAVSAEDALSIASERLEAAQFAAQEAGISMESALQQADGFEEFGQAERAKERAALQMEVHETKEICSDLYEGHEDRRRKKEVVEASLTKKHYERERSLRTEVMEWKIKSKALEAEIEYLPNPNPNPNPNCKALEAEIEYLRKELDSAKCRINEGGYSDIAP